MNKLKLILTFLIFGNMGFAQEEMKPTINFNNLIQEGWTQQETDNAKLIVDFFQHLMNEHNFDYVLEKFSTGKYTQHNRSIPNGIEGLVGYVKTVAKRYPEYSFDVKRIIASGDYVVLHSHATLKAKHRNNEKKGYIITDTFRLNDGKLAEHWDAIQPIDSFSRFYHWVAGGKIGNDNPTF